MQKGKGKGMRKVYRRGVSLLLAVLLILGMGAVTSAEEETVTAQKLPNGKAVYNILLIGTDRRDDSWNGNSDVVIVATVNTAAQKLCLTSFMRDLYADIPGHGIHKLNYAYAIGGAETLIATLESNYEIEIDNYAMVDFETMADIIDLAGGVDMTISDAECDLLNGYLISMNATEYSLPCGGTYTLNGTQAVAFMRDRYVGNNDYQRTQRQRDVLRSLFESLQKLGAGEMAALAGEIFLMVDHDINPFELLSLTAGLSTYMSYPLGEARIPYDDLYHSENELLIPDFAQTIERLHDSMYEGVTE